ncbi:MAG: S-layer homology domain-containing protein [Clostridia bacterium]|nr:S-layer homology domain-containing protein [Clostridia bacterium]
MRNFKRTLALVLAVLVVVGTFATVSAAETPWYQPGVDYIQSIGVDSISATKADQKITRNDFVLWVAKIESHQLLDSAWKDEVAGVDFTDVTDAHHKAAIAYSKQAHFIIGNGDGTFAPDKATTLAEAAAVIVRMMGYEDKVYDTSDENWKYNYMRVAQMYCYAFDQVFLANTATYNYDYELSYGEAAYLLASIMNCSEIVKDRSLTADGIDLGDYFVVNNNLGVTENTYYVVDMTRLQDTTNRGGQASNPHTFDTNLLDTNKAVVLAPVNGGALLTIEGEEFLRQVRLALGLPEYVDFMNEADEIAVFEHVQLGTLVNVKLDRQTGAMLAFDIAVGDTNSVVVNTYVQATSLAANNANFSNKYLGWHAAAVGTSNNFIPVLPTSYTEALATSWTNIVKNTDGVITSAVLNFQGKQYKVGPNADIEVLDGTDFDVVTGKYTALTADEAVNTLINAAQGSVYAVFNDTDNDGAYETVIVHKSDAFKIFSGVNNVSGADDTNAYPYITALSNGETIKQKDAEGNVVTETVPVLDEEGNPVLDEEGNPVTVEVPVEVKETAKYSAIGTVLFNFSIKYPNGTGLTTAWSNLCSDAWTNVGEATGKLQLAIAAEDGLGVLGTAGQGASAQIHPIYKVIDLAEFSTGIIEEIDAFALKEYYVAKIRTVDGTLKTVYIPVEAKAKTTFDVTIGGATAEYTLDSSAWCTFLTEAADAVAEGIVSATADEVKAITAAWMAGKYVNFAVDAEGVAICLLSTDKSTGISGFVVDAEKVDGVDNIYNVTIAQSGSNAHSSYTYLTEILKSHFANSPAPGSGIFGYDRPGQSGGFSNMFVEDANNPGTYVAKGGKTVTINGITYPADSKGNLFISSKTNSTSNGVAGVVTKEVRASASSMFDWANYEVYSAIFAGDLLDPNYDYDKNVASTDNCKVNPGTDLIYVEVIADGGSNYLKYVPYTADSVAATTGNEYFFINGNSSTFRNRWYYPLYTLEAFTAENSWNAIQSGHIIDIVENEVIASGLNAAGIVEKTVKYAAVVGFEPYYERSYNSKTESYEYTIKYATVVIYDNVIGTADGIVDEKSTYMVPLYYGVTGKESVQVKVTTEEEAAKYPLPEFFVDDDGYVFIIVSNIGIKWETVKDANGKEDYAYTAISYDWANADELATIYDVALTDVATPVNAAIAALDVNNDADTINDFAIAEVKNVDKTYATVKFINKVNGDAGYYPGAAYAVIDIEDAAYTTKHTVTAKTPVVLVTPSADGFKTQVYTVKELIDSKIELFVTEWNATVKQSGDISGIAVLGTVSGVQLSDATPSNPVVTPTKDTQLVYLNKSAKAVIRAGHNNENWLVISDESAVALPSGESVGQIYRAYSTYEEAKAAYIDLSIQGGNYYLVDKNCMIVEGDTSYATDIKIGKLVSENAAGQTMADMGDGKVVDVSNKDFAWFYRDVEGNLVKAGDNKNVSIISGAAYEDLFTKLEDAVKTTKATFEVKEAAWKAGKLSDSKYEYYKAEYEAAVAALAEARVTNIDKYFNGQFWGFANSPYYTYVAMGAGSFQQEVSYLWFEYVEIDGTICVFSDTYMVTEPAAN